jgi:hypothetical protein
MLCYGSHPSRVDLTGRVGVRPVSKNLQGRDAMGSVGKVRAVP